MNRGRHLVLRGQTSSQHLGSFDQTSQSYFTTPPLPWLHFIDRHGSLEDSIIDDTDSLLPHQEQEPDQREQENDIITSSPLGIQNQGLYEAISNKWRALSLKLARQNRQQFTTARTLRRT
jgi:hypothetical protein